VLAFMAVGVIGFLLQITALAVLTMGVGWPYVPATAVAVELAVLHNFWWHERWTWSDRALPKSAAGRRAAKYHATAAVTSLGGNLLMTAAFVELAGLPVVPANVAAVAVMAFANFAVTDRWVFARHAAAPLAVLLAFTPSTAAAAEASPAAIAAWHAFIAKAETRLHACSCEPGKLEGKTIDVPGGTIHQWRGSVVVRGVTVDEVLRALMHPGTPPPQEDVLESRVLSRSGDALKVYLKVTRRAIVTVTYDTEHDVVFQRHSAGLAASRSVATRIAEVDGRDRGFLWRLNSYWRYTQQPDGVRIDVESLSLSRGVPALVKPAASPVIGRVGRESMTRTLEAVRRFLDR
jgi:putative flippase GtrA